MVMLLEFSEFCRQEFVRAFKHHDATALEAARASRCLNHLQREVAQLARDLELENLLELPQTSTLGQNTSPSTVEPMAQRQPLSPSGCPPPSQGPSHSEEKGRAEEEEEDLT